MSEDQEIDFVDWVQQGYQTLAVPTHLPYRQVSLFGDEVYDPDFAPPQEDEET